MTVAAIVGVYLLVAFGASYSIGSYLRRMGRDADQTGEG